MKLKKLKFCLLAVAGVLVLSAIIMVLWNVLIPDIFGLKLINFWQALGLFALSRLLFGRFGGGPRRGFGPGCGKEKGRRMFEKWSKMTAEQRKELICKRRGFESSFDKDPFDIAEDGAPKKEH